VSVVVVARVNAGSVKDVAPGQEMKRCFADSCVLMLHIMHSMMASQPFLCRFWTVCSLSCRINQMNILILGGTG
jgi:hypothetical protein